VARDADIDASCVPFGTATIRSGQPSRAERSASSIRTIIAAFRCCLLISFDVTWLVQYEHTGKKFA